MLGSSAFDIAEYAPMLDQEPYLSDTNQKLQLPITLGLKDCAIDHNATLDVSITFDFIKRDAPNPVRDTVAKAVLGKFLSTNHLMKKEEVVAKLR